MSLSTHHWKVGLYAAAVVAAAWLWFWILKLGFQPGEWIAITVLMWIPGLVSILFRLLFKEGFADVGWRVGKARFWLWAYLGPWGLATSLEKINSQAYLRDHGKVMEELNLVNRFPYLRPSPRKQFSKNRLRGPFGFP